MSVIRPRPPTDPIQHRPPASAGAEIGAWREAVAACAAVREEVLAAAGDPALAMLTPYGTTRSQARRGESLLFAILALARDLRETVDRVVVIGDRLDRAAVDLLLSTCCHPFHDALPRADRGGRPRIVTVGPEDDDDTIQGVLDLLAVRGGDHLADAWGVVLAGPGESRAARRCARLFTGGDRPGAGPHELPAAVVIAADCPCVAGPGGAAEWIAPQGAVADGRPRRTGDVFTAAGLLPAAVGGIDVVRLLEGAAAMQRRFREAPADTNPVLGCAAVGPWLRRREGGQATLPERRLEAEGNRWRGLRRWVEELASPHGTEPVATTFATAVRVGERRRRPFLGIDEAGDAGGRRPALDWIDLPRCDEHAIGQLLELLRLAAAVERRMA